MYDDEYNRKIASTVLKRSRRKAMNVDRLNGAGARSYDNTGDRTQHPAKYWFNQENEVFKADITRPDVQPESVVRERASQDLGAGKYGRCKGGIVGMPDRGSLSNVEPQSVIHERANLDLGAGKCGSGTTGGFLPLLGLAAATFLPKLLGQGYSGGGVTGGIVGMYLKKEIGKGQMTKMIKDALPHGKKKMAGGMSAAICKEFGKQRGKGYSGGAMDYDDDDDYVMESDDSDMEGGALPLRETGYGALGSDVGGKMCCKRCKCRCGAGMTGGYGPVAPTTESLYGYDNRAQPRGLVPPDSVNQEPGMGDEQYVGSGRSKGGFLKYLKYAMPILGMMGDGRPASMSQLGRNMLPVDQLPSNTGGIRTRSGLETRNRKMCCFPSDLCKGKPPKYRYNGRGGAKMCPRNYSPVTSPKTGRTYSNKCAMDASEEEGSGRTGGRLLANSTNYASNSGSIVPSLQSRVSIGSGARSARGAMVSKLMKEKGMTLGEASRYIKENK